MQMLQGRNLEPKPSIRKSCPRSETPFGRKGAKFTETWLPEAHAVSWIAQRVELLGPIYDVYVHPGRHHWFRNSKGGTLYTGLSLSLSSLSLPLPLSLSLCPVSVYMCIYTYLCIYLFIHLFILTDVCIRKPYKERRGVNHNFYGVRQNFLSDQKGFPRIERILPAL